MDRRKFLAAGVAAASALAIESSALGEPIAQADGAPKPDRLDLTRCRFGVNYTPSHNWWFCWNDWNIEPDPARPGCHCGAGRGPPAHHAHLALLPAQSRVGQSRPPGAAGSIADPDGPAQPGRAGHGLHRPTQRLVFPAVFQSPQQRVLHHRSNVASAGTLCAGARPDHGSGTPTSSASTSATSSTPAGRRTQGRATSGWSACSI